MKELLVAKVRLLTKYKRGTLQVLKVKVLIPPFHKVKFRF